MNPILVKESLHNMVVIENEPLINLYFCIIIYLYVYSNKAHEYYRMFLEN